MLSLAAEKKIDQYFNLPFPGIKGVRCPYFNNSRSKQRGQLRVLTGKGSPDEIVEESKIISIQYHAGLFKKHSGWELCHDRPISSDEIRNFLIKHNLGIECSGFVTQILKSHFQETKNFDFTRKIFITSPKNIIRWTISRFRPIESISVKVLSDERNSTKIIGEGIGYNYENVKSGDLVIMLETGPSRKRNHVLLIREKKGNLIKYVHARAWGSEGLYGHGVSEGVITITNPLEDLLKQQWAEKNMNGEKNETFIEAREAKTLEIRRLKV